MIGQSAPVPDSRPGEWQVRRCGGLTCLGVGAGLQLMEANLSGQLS